MFAGELVEPHLWNQFMDYCFGEQMPFVHGWYVAAWSDEVIADKPLARKICGESVVLYRTLDGTAAALEDRCCHRAAPLHLGRVVKEGLQCGYHGLVFNCAGTCVLIPGQERIPSTAKVKSFPVVEKNQVVWIWHGPAEAADESLIIDYPWHDDPQNWPHKRSMYPVQADYMLLIDNVMDLTHIGYLHAATIGGNPEQHVGAKMTTTPTPRGVKFVRWLLNSNPPPTYVKAMGFTKNVDRWQEFEFIAPGNIIQFVGGQEVGKGAYEEDRRDGGFRVRRFHGFTPETETSCFYFWSSANGYKPSDAQATEQLFQEIGATLYEDKVMVEAQQKKLTERGEGGLVGIRSDATRMAMRRKVAEMLTSQKS